MLLMLTTIWRFLLRFDIIPDIVTCPIINGTGAADCMDVGPANGETGALKPPKEISSVVAPSEKELFMKKVSFLLRVTKSTHSSITE